MPGSICADTDRASSVSTGRLASDLGHPPSTGRTSLTSMTKTIVVLSTSVPPARSGQAIVLGRLLRDFGGEIHFFTDDEKSLTLGEPAPVARVVRLQPLLFGLSMRAWPSALGYVNEHVGAMRPIRLRSDQVLRELKGARPSVIVACSGNPFDLPAAALVAKKTGAKLIAYLFDDPVFQCLPGRTRDIVRRLEGLWTKVAAHIVCPNEALAAAIENRTGRTPTVIRNPIDGALSLEGQDAPEQVSRSPAMVVYTGAVSESQAEALARMSVLVSASRGKYEFHIFTDQTAAELAAFGIAGEAVYLHSYLPFEAIAARQRQADVLFLPLSFESRIQEALMTASPGKLGDYLASGRPILAHVPPGSFASDFLGHAGAALVVDDRSEGALERGLSLLVTDANLRARLVEKASSLVRLFSLPEAQRQFWSLLEQSPGGYPPVRQTTRFTKSV